MPLIIGLTYDLKPANRQTRKPINDYFAEHDTEETVSAVEKALQSRGHKVRRIGSSKALLEILPKLKCDIVFNIAEGLSGRNRESQVPLILEICGIPYVGSDALTLSISLDKIISKKIFAYHKIPTPAYFECVNVDDTSLPKGLDYPLMVKPRYEGSAKGIEPDSRVDNYKALRKKVERIIRVYRQPALIEEFIDGWEFTVGIIGNGATSALPVVQRHVEIKTGFSSHIFKKFVSGKNNLEYREFLDIDPGLESGIKHMALEAFSGLECRDFARLDFRVSRDELDIYLLEINPLPSLAKDDYFAMTSELLGVSYDEMINMILDSALERYGCR